MKVKVNRQKYLCPVSESCEENCKVYVLALAISRISGCISAYTGLESKVFLNIYIYNTVTTC